eukprot:TRINITY_DN15837_c0_g1_i1.p1 TRINITY_DN15837_c0_g1~~TRINITY_DN15837_c0_g1_i1.p1  ORF type:complete len:672 (+),score=125.64 TRINITY_DN15837_c0_g1_i1:49-2064(+)
MGCGISHPPGTTKTAGPKQGGAVEGVDSTNTRRGSPGQEVVTTGPRTGKEEHMRAPIIKEVDQDGKVYYLATYPADADMGGLTIVCRDVGGTVWVKTMADTEVAEWKKSGAPNMSWKTFWRAFTTAFVRGEPPRAVATTGNKRRLDISLKSGKDQRLLLPIELANFGTDANLTFTYFYLPFLDSYTLRKKQRAPSEDLLEATEANINIWEARTEDILASIDQTVPKVEQLRSKARTANQEQLESAENLEKVEKSVRKAKKYCMHGKSVHHLDGLYNEGGARPFQHLKWSKEHEPALIQCDEALLKVITHKYENTQDKAPLHISPTDPAVANMLEATQDREVTMKVLACLESLDDIHFNPFELDKLTEGGALLVTAWALTYKYNLCSQFSIDPYILRNFWLGVTSGYHDNPYHNATHAADVLQCTHYIIGPGKLSSLVRLKKEDELAALIAAGIHDYDHPGFNNSFHTRTQAYLGILYNDRSILENHHCACVFEMMRHPRYNILSSLNDDQKKEVRDTIVEMLLSTDMGNHAKIFSQFRRRLAENPEWHSRREDVRLAMVMAIKMADISNCSRPQDLYLRWADCIASEFYNQGDAELRLALTVSPFMDRRKHNCDFSKGQISFMNYIVLPMFEDMAQLLPCLQSMVVQCEQNKSYWESLRENIPPLLQGIGV